MSNNQPIKLRAAIQRMRDLSEKGIPFSFGFIKCNLTTGTSDGYKVVNKALLRKGYKDNQSSKSNVLIAYTDYDNAESDRHFYLPLLMMFNGNKIIP